MTTCYPILKIWSSSTHTEIKRILCPPYEVALDPGTYIFEALSGYTKSRNIGNGLTVIPSISKVVRVTGNSGNLISVELSLISNMAGTITFRIISSDQNQVIETMSTTIYRYDTLIYTSFDDDPNEFSFTDYRGVYSITISAPFHQSKTISFEIDNNPDKEVDIVLDYSPIIDPIEYTGLTVSVIPDNIKSYITVHNVCFNVNEEHKFNYNYKRDEYFTLHPDDLVDSIYITTRGNEIFQQYDALLEEWNIASSIVASVDGPTRSFYLDGLYTIHASTDVPGYLCAFATLDISSSDNTSLLLELTTFATGEINITVEPEDVSSIIKAPIGNLNNLIEQSIYGDLSGPMQTYHLVPGEYTFEVITPDVNYTGNSITCKVASSEVINETINLIAMIPPTITGFVNVIVSPEINCTFSIYQNETLIASYIGYEKIFELEVGSYSIEISPLNLFYNSQIIDFDIIDSITTNLEVNLICNAPGKLQVRIEPICVATILDLYLDGEILYSQHGPNILFEDLDPSTYTIQAISKSEYYNNSEVIEIEIVSFETTEQIITLEKIPFPGTLQVFIKPSSIDSIIYVLDELDEIVASGIGPYQSFQLDAGNYKIYATTNNTWYETSATSSITINSGQEQTYTLTLPRIIISPKMIIFNINYTYPGSTVVYNGQVYGPFNTKNITLSKSVYGSANHTFKAIKSPVFPGAGIAQFNGLNTYLTVNNSSEFNFERNDHTIEFFLMLNKYPDQDMVIISKGGSWIRHRSRIYIRYTGVLYYYEDWYGGIGTIIYSKNIVPLHEWIHIAIVRKSCNCSLYINGVLNNTMYNENAIVENPYNLVIGKFMLQYPFFLDGALSEIRISNIARYSTDFTIQTSKFNSDASTSLLLHFNDNTGKIIDSSSNNFTVTKAGDIITSNAVGFVGEKSMYIDYDAIKNRSVFTVDIPQYLIGNGLSFIDTSHDLDGNEIGGE